MRLVDGLVYVSTTRQAVLDREQVAREADPATTAAARASATGTAPTIISGNTGARGRYGGLDLPGSLVGALATVGCLVLIGGLLAAIFDVEPTVIDTNLGTFALVTSGAMLAGFATIFLSFLVGGWATGRSSRFDGVANSFVMVLWVLGLGVLLGALGAWANDRYDLYVNADLPSFQTDDFAVWGSVAFVVAFVLMLAGAALGGAIGEAWHRRADRAMLGVVAVPTEGSAPVQGTSDATTRRPLS
jgi:hypothetical protein